VRAVERHPAAAPADVAASFQEAVVDVLIAKAARAVTELGATGLCLAGGVAANSLLRRRAAEWCDEAGVTCLLPSLAFCTDNAAMVAAAGRWRLLHEGPSPGSLGAEPNLRLPIPV
jgi:N6-L-threonylcarbamoyladenine synthase